MYKDNEVLELVCKVLIKQYNLTFSQPYDDEYTEVFNRGGQMIGSFNPSGRTLLANLSALTSMLQSELL